MIHEKDTEHHQLNTWYDSLRFGNDLDCDRTVL